MITQPEPPQPLQPVMLIEAGRAENAQLRSRVADLERDSFSRVEGEWDIPSSTTRTPSKTWSGLRISNRAWQFCFTFSIQFTCRYVLPTFHRRIPASGSSRANGVGSGTTAGPSTTIGTSAVLSLVASPKQGFTSKAYLPQHQPHPTRHPPLRLPTRAPSQTRPRILQLVGCGCPPLYYAREYSSYYHPTGSYLPLSSATCPVPRSHVHPNCSRKV